MIISCLFVLSCENSERSIEEWSGRRALVEEAIQVQTHISQGGKLRAKLAAPYMIRSSSDTVYVEFPKTLTVHFFDSAGKIESYLSSMYGKYYENLNRVFLRDSVLVYNMQGDTLRCPELWWDQTTQKFYTDKEVRIHKKRDRIYGGKGLEARQDLSDVIIKSPSGSVVVPDSILAR